MKLLTVTNLYPCQEMPRHGVFIRERLEQLTVTGRVSATVVALRPGIGAAARSQPAASSAGIRVTHCAVPSLPMVSNWIDPLVWASAARAQVAAEIGEDRRNTLIDGHFLYPDGVAAVILARRLGVPVVLSARGSDVNVKCRNPVMRRWVCWAAARAGAVIAVSQALADAILQYDIRPRRLEVLPNGVDHEKFRPVDRTAAKAHFGVAGRVMASVGHLTPEKGHAIAIESLCGLPNVTLLIVGDGSGKPALERLARRIGVARRVVFAGLVPHAEMPQVYSASDVLVLASAREGMPNVILESLACGTPVVATDVGGVREVLTSPVAGELMRERSVAALVEAVETLFARSTRPQFVREFSRQFGWKPIIERQLELYESVLNEAQVVSPSTTMGMRRS